MMNPSVRRNPNRLKSESTEAIVGCCTMLVHDELSPAASTVSIGHSNPSWTGARKDDVELHLYDPASCADHGMNKSTALTRAHRPGAVTGFSGTVSPPLGPKGHPFEKVKTDDAGEHIYAVEDGRGDGKGDTAPTKAPLDTAHWSNSALKLDGKILSNGTNYIQTHGTVYVYSRHDQKRDMRKRLFDMDPGFN